MCEWLSCEEWCDVFLLCGGRVFSAHRAVLASVSKFLRNILLSCPDNETPTFIFMPEFDFETMSSVLHYIYNGEVALDKHQVETFLDIVNALQVFVDTRDLIKSKLNNYNLNRDENKLKKENVPLSGNYITFKKEPNVRFSNNKKNVDQCSLDAKCFKSKEIQSGYLKSLKDRQSQPFSRDLFIETYSLNRNGNGVTEGVLTISNERYHEPASLLETNANTEHLRRAHTETYKKDSEDNLNSLYNTEHLDISKISNAKNYFGMHLKSKAKKVNENNVLNRTEREDMHACTAIMDNSISSLNLDTKNLEDTFPTISEINKEFSKSKETISRVAIHNEVLQNPWRPRLSLTFTPCSKKFINRKPEKEKNVQLKQNCASNSDKNNNNNRTTKNENNENEAVTNMKEMKRNVIKDLSADTKDEHMAHKSTRYTCNECHKSFSQLRNYKYHMSVHRGTKEFATTCPVCGKFFNDKGYLSSHMKIHRNRKEYKCSLCPKSFNQRVAYNMHVRIHTGVKPHVCDECGKAFSRKMLLKQHQRTHSGERPYACQHCNKRFADRSNMTLHLRLHTGVKPFACSLCPKSFTKKHHLKSHLNFHTGDKPYTCPRCKLAFTQSSNMRTHMKKCNVQD